MAKELESGFEFRISAVALSVRAVTTRLSVPHDSALLSESILSAEDSDHGRIPQRLESGHGRLLYERSV